MYRVVYAERSFYEWHEHNGGSELHYRVFMNDFHAAQSASVLSKNNMCFYCFLSTQPSIYLEMRSI